MEWRLDDSLESEQLNTLILLDKSFKSLPDTYKPAFHVLGGTALLFHGITSVVTIDIDIANRLSDKIRPMVEPFISDNASEVATLAKYYQCRLVPFHPDEFKHIAVYLLSVEDLVITKLGSFRHKDKEDLTKTDLLQRVDHDKLLSIMKNEFDEETHSKVLLRLASLD